MLRRPVFAVNTRPCVRDAQFTGLRDAASRPRSVKRLPTFHRGSGAKAVHARGTVKATLGSVNVPVVVAGQAILPGDAIIADDDGVVVVAHASVDKAIELGEKRVANETSKRERLAAGELGLDIYNMRPELEKLGLRYLDELPKA